MSDLGGDLLKCLSDWRRRLAIDSAMDYGNGGEKASECTHTYTFVFVVSYVCVLVKGEHAKVRFDTWSLSPIVKLTLSLKFLATRDPN